jgi:hypothetical protein
MMLAMSLGMTVGEMLDRMSASELAEWMEFLKHEPWGPYRGDALAMSGWCYSLMSGIDKPDQAIRSMALPWIKAQDRIKEVTPAQLKMMLMSFGGGDADG